MFNRSKFNTSGFNVNSGSESSFSANLTANSSSKCKLNMISSFVFNDISYSIITGELIKAIDFNKGYMGSNTNLLSQAIRQKELSMYDNSVSEMNSKTFYQFGYESIVLPNITLQPSDELIIDTEKMTVTLNGQNVINLITNDSSFFNLKQGENIVTYIDKSASRDISFKILHKDRWL